MVLCSGAVPVSGVESRSLYGVSSGPALTGIDYCPEEDTSLLSCIEQYSGVFFDCSQNPQFPVGVRCECELKLKTSC